MDGRSFENIFRQAADVHRQFHSLQVLAMIHQEHEKILNRVRVYVEETEDLRREEEQYWDDFGNQLIQMKDKFLGHLERQREKRQQNERQFLLMVEQQHEGLRNMHDEMLQQLRNIVALPQYPQQEELQRRQHAHISPPSFVLNVNVSGNNEGASGSVFPPNPPAVLPEQNKEQLKEEEIEIKQEKMEIKEDEIKIKEEEIEIKQEKMEIKEDEIEIKEEEIEIKEEDN